jgi:transcriptional regulator with XRE-family HTH domain
MRQSRRALTQSVFLSALGAAIRSRRVQLNLTIVQVAERLGRSAAVLSRLEAGRLNVTLLRLGEIAAALEIPLPDLLRLAERRMVRARRRRPAVKRSQ